MATEINKELFDFLVHEKLATGRYATQQVSNTLRLLNDSMKDIVAKVVQRGEDGTATAKRLNALIAEISEMIDDTYWAAEKQLHSELGGFALHQTESTAAVLSAQVPVAFSATALNSAQIAAMTDGSPIGGKLLAEWWQSLSTSMATKTAQQIRIGVVSGEGIPQIVRRLTGSARDYEPGIFSIVRRETEAVVRTAVIGISNNAVMATYNQNQDIVKGWVYLGTLDSRLCPQCIPDYGKRYDLGKGPIPPKHINCRCFAAPELRTFRELGVDLDEMPAGKKASAGGVVSSEMTYPEWFKGQSAGVQKDILGARRAKLYQDGNLDIGDFTTDKGRLLTLAQLKDNHASAFARAFGN